jgi:predicted nucleotidyltransferase
MRLTSDEQVWLEAYRRVLQAQYPGVVVRMAIYGSKARGDDHPDSDLDVLLIVKNEAAHLKRPLRRLGYELAATSDAVPSILAYTQDEWESRKATGASFQHTVERDAVPVL